MQKSMEQTYAEALRSVEGRAYPWGSVTPLNRLETTNRELLLALYTSRHGERPESVRQALRRATGRKHVFLAPSGRCAIARILSLLPHPEVVMPAFTCPSVKMAAQVAGKRIVYVDCADGRLNATSAEFAAQARPGRVLVPTHLFGLSTDAENICALAREQHCVTIEDCAGVFPSRSAGRLPGTFADFGVFSFQRTKRMPAFRGAAIVVNNEDIVDPATLESHLGVAAEDGLPIGDVLRALIYNAATVPSVYGRFTLGRLLRGRRTVFRSEHPDTPEAARKTPYYSRAFHAYQADLVLRVLERSDALGEHIERLAAVYRRALASTPVRMFATGECDERRLWRFPIAIPGIERGEILRRALRRGLYLETNYEGPLPPEPDRSRYPNAMWAAENLVLLPLYGRLSLDAAETIAQRAAGIIDEAARVSAA